MATPGLPRPAAWELSKTALLEGLAALDKSVRAQNRVKKMEDGFRTRIQTHLESLAKKSQKLFKDYKTNPFVLLMYSCQQGFSHIHEIEAALVPAKAFSSMETSAGKMVELVVLSHYGWKCVDSKMQSSDSVVDGKRLDGKTLRIVTLKSGPDCINDSIYANIAADIVEFAPTWAKADKVKHVEFTVGILYGTRKRSNKKDWHVLRTACENVEKKKSKSAKVVKSHFDSWSCQLELDGITVDVQAEIGKSLWDMIGGKHDAFTEMLCAAIRACVDPSNSPRDCEYRIPDLANIVGLSAEQKKLNFTILQKSQIEWFLLMAAHFADKIVD